MIVSRFWIWDGYHSSYSRLARLNISAFPIRVRLRPALLKRKPDWAVELIPEAKPPKAWFNEPDDSFRFGSGRFAVPCLDLDRLPCAGQRHHAHLRGELCGTSITYATGTDIPLALDTTLKVSFDDGVTSIETDANDYAVQYGLPVVSSPLTVTLPYAPAPGSTPPSSEVVLDNRDYGPPQQWAELAIVESLDKVQQGFTAREYDFDLDSGSSLPLNPILAQNGTGALYSQLLAYEQNQTAFTFGEYAEEYNTQTGQSIAGIGYRANAFVTDIQQTPEPSTFPIVSAAAIALALKRRCRATLP